MEDKDALESKKSGVAGLFCTGKERVVFRPSERKSMLGLDVLANAKRGGSKVDDGLKVPEERVTSVGSTIDEEEKSEFSRLDEEESDMANGARNTNRRYRETAASENSNPVSELTLASVVQPNLASPSPVESRSDAGEPCRLKLGVVWRCVVLFIPDLMSTSQDLTLVELVSLPAS
ncbi:hypothetical protein NL676_019873 [Syzygium grande]|nr:hypothetical protein NL676_019873 [Syzygium grande]